MGLLFHTFPLRALFGSRTVERNNQILMESLLQVRNLTVHYRSNGRQQDAAVNALSFDIAPGETLGLMGESGCGKSTTALALLGLLQNDRVEVSGSARFGGLDLLALDERAFQRVRGSAISIVYQEPGIALSPVMRVGEQVAEVIHAHRHRPWKCCRTEAQAMLGRVGLSQTDRIFSAYPHQLSGGQCQRVVLAQALACDPTLLIADEPTAHLDARGRADFLDLLQTLKKQSRISMLLISHTPEIQARLSDRLLVMKAGKIIEHGRFAQLYRDPSHDYTRRILHSGLQERAYPKIATEVPLEEQLTR